MVWSKIVDGEWRKIPKRVHWALCVISACQCPIVPIKPWQHRFALRCKAVGIVQHDRELNH